MKILLFDIDSTLLVCDTESNVKGSEVMFKKVFSIDANEELIDNAGKTEKGIIEEVLRKIDPNLYKEEIEIPNHAYQVWAQGTEKTLKNNPPRVLPGIEELLTELSQDKDIKLGLLTGNSRFRADVKLKAVNLDKYFINEKGVLTGAFGDISNNRADLIQEAKDKYGEGIYILIDDSLIGAKLSRDNNIDSILVGTGKAIVEELKKYSDYVFEDFGERRWQKVITIIKEL